MLSIHMNTIHMNTIHMNIYLEDYVLGVSQVVQLWLLLAESSYRVNYSGI